MRKTTQRNIARAGQVFTVVDAGMTAGFGFMASSTFLLKPVYAAGLGSISYVLAFLPVVAVAAWMRGFKPLAGLIMIIYVGGFVGNFFSNYGLSAAVFKGNIIKAQNANTRSDDARQRVTRLREKDAQLTQQIDFVPIAGGKSWLAPDAYENLIAAQKVRTENGRNIYQRSKQCTEVTVGTSEQVCKTIGELRATRDNAIARLAAIEERKQVRSELKAAEEESEGKPKEVSVAAAQAEYLARIFTMELQPDGKTVDWTVMGVAVSISLFIAVFAHLCNLIPALNLANDREEDVPRETSTVSQNPWLPDQRPADARPLHAETVPGGHHAYHNSKTFVVPGAVADVDWDTMKGNIAESMRMAAMAQEILKRKTPESV